MDPRMDLHAEVLSEREALLRNGRLPGSLRFQRAVGDQVRAQPPECLRDVTIPADRLVRGKNVRQFLGPDMLPLGRPEIRS